MSGLSAHQRTDDARLTCCGLMDNSGYPHKSSSYGHIKVDTAFNPAEPAWLPAYVNHPRDSEHECVWTRSGCRRRVSSRITYNAGLRWPPCRRAWPDNCELGGGPAVA